MPLLVVFGDHRDNADRHPDAADLAALVSRRARRLIGRIKARRRSGARCSAPPDRGIRGNSHMIMQDKNNLQIADLILQWIGEHARKRSAGEK